MKKIIFFVLVLVFSLSYVYGQEKNNEDGLTKAANWLLGDSKKEDSKQDQLPEIKVVSQKIIPKQVKMYGKFVTQYNWEVVIENAKGIEMTLVVGIVNSGGQTFAMEEVVTTPRMDKATVIGVLKGATQEDFKMAELFVVEVYLGNYDRYFRRAENKQIIVKEVPLH
jgi:hypothetical protein